MDPNVNQSSNKRRGKKVQSGLRDSIQSGWLMMASDGSTLGRTIDYWYQVHGFDSSHCWHWVKIADKGLVDILTARWRDRILVVNHKTNKNFMADNKTCSDHRYLWEVDCSRHIIFAKNQLTKVLVVGTSKAASQQANKKCAPFNCQNFWASH